MRARRQAAVVLAWLVAVPTANAQSLTLSGGLDLRSEVVAPPVGWDAGLGVFVNVRKVFADERGDRFVLVAQVDLEEELERSHLYQVYGQLKGPLGRWNVRAGRYLVPFGLLAYHDTERLLLRAHEPEALGIRLDEGVALLGFAGKLDYAASVSRGLDDTPTPVARIGLVLGDSRVGVSWLYGRLPSFSDAERMGLDELAPRAELVEKHRVALDLEHLAGRVTFRAEPVAGSDADQLVAGGYGEVGVALSARWELAANGAGLWSGLTGTRWRAGAGLGFELVPRVFLRGSWIHRDDFRVSQEAFSVQLYGDFSQELGG